MRFLVNEIIFLTIIIKSISNNRMISASQEKMGAEIKEIYGVLMKYGFPGLVASNVMQSVDEMEKILQDYFQPNIKR